MLCAISGEAPQQPVASRKSGNVFEKRLIEAYIAENGTDPVNGEELAIEELIDLKQSRSVTARPPTLTSIPALLSTFQNEWDATVLETYTLRQQLAETRQELSTALYYNDAAQRVIARLQKERDEARAALSRVSLRSDTAVATNGDTMHIDSKGLPESVLGMIDETQARLSATRRKRPVPEDWATADAITAYEVLATVETQFTGGRSLASDSTGELFLCGDSDGSIGVFDLASNSFTTRVNLESGAILNGTWARDKIVVCTATGNVVLAHEGLVSAKFDQHAGPANDVAVHPSGDLIASVGSDGTYILYDVNSSQVLTQVNCNQELYTVAIHPDGQLLAAGTVSGSILLYDIKSSQLMHTFESSEDSSKISALSFSENGTWLASSLSGQSVATVWHLGKTNVFASLDMGTPVQSLMWDYTGQFLAACGPGGVVVKHYVKSSKSWSEPLRKALSGEAVQWASNARRLMVLTSEETLSVLGA